MAMKAQSEPPVTKKVKDAGDGLRQAESVLFLLEEADFDYQLGVAESFCYEIRKFLSEAIRFYKAHGTRHESALNGYAKRHMKTANKYALTALARGLNELLRIGKHEQITFPTSIARLERAFHKLFYVGAPNNVGESKGSGGTQDGSQDTGPLPMA